MQNVASLFHVFYPIGKTMQLPIESALLLPLLDYWAPAHAESLALSESIEPDSLEVHLAHQVRFRKAYTFHKADDKSRALLFIAASDLPNSPQKLLFYLSKLKPGGVAIIERPALESAYYKKIALPAGVQVLYHGKIKDIPGFSLTRQLRSHGNTSILVLEKLLPKSAGKKKISILLTKPDAMLHRLSPWLSYIQERDMQGACEIFYRTSSKSEILKKSYIDFAYPIFAPSNVAFVRSAFCLSESHFFLLDASTKGCFVPCDEMQTLFLAMLQHKKEDSVQIIYSTPHLSDPKSGKPLLLPLRKDFFYELWNRNFAEQFFLKTSWPKSKFQSKQLKNLLPRKYTSTVCVRCVIK